MVVVVVMIKTTTGTHVCAHYKSQPTLGAWCCLEAYHASQGCACVDRQHCCAFPDITSLHGRLGDRFHRFPTTHDMEKSVSVTRCGHYTSGLLFIVLLYCCAGFIFLVCHCVASVYTSSNRIACVVSSVATGMPPGTWDTPHGVMITRNKSGRNERSPSPPTSLVHRCAFPPSRSSSSWRRSLP